MQTSIFRQCVLCSEFPFEWQTTLGSGSTSVSRDHWSGKPRKTLIFDFGLKKQASVQTCSAASQIQVNKRKFFSNLEMLYYQGAMKQGWSTCSKFQSFQLFQQTYHARTIFIYIYIYANVPTYLLPLHIHGPCFTTPYYQTIKHAQYKVWYLTFDKLSIIGSHYLSRSSLHFILYDWIDELSWLRFSWSWAVV